MNKTRNNKNMISLSIFAALTAATLSVSLVFLSASPAFAQTQASGTSEIETKKAELGDINKRIEMNDSELKKIKADIERIKAEYEARKREYEAAREELGKNRKKSGELTEERQRLARELKLSTENLLRKKSILTERIRIIYKNSYKKKAAFVFESKSITDFYVNIYYLSRMINWDSDFISDISKKVAKIKVDRERMAQAIKETELLAGSSEDNEKNLRSSAARMDRALAELEQRSRLISSQSGELASERTRLAGEITSISETRARLEAEDAKKAAEKKTAEIAATSKNNQQADNLPAVTLENLSLSWPLKKSKNVLSFFGVQKDPKYSVNYFNSGVDIAGSTGEEVVCSAAGHVRYKGEMKSVGKLLIIDHGGGITTLYSHLGSITVGMGQKVTTGEAIGFLGDKPPESPSAFLHFEIRLNGTARDPMDYL